MARTPPKTKAGKQRKVKTVMDEWKGGDLRSSSGQKVTNPKQAIAIALSESGQAKKPAAGGNKGLSDRLTQRLAERDR